MSGIDEQVDERIAVDTDSRFAAVDANSYFNMERMHMDVAKLVDFVYGNDPYISEGRIPTIEDLIVYGYMTPILSSSRWIEFVARYAKMRIKGNISEVEYVER